MKLTTQAQPLPEKWCQLALALATQVVHWQTGTEAVTDGCILKAY